MINVAKRMEFLLSKGRLVFDYSGLGKHRWMDFAMAAVPVVTRWAAEAGPQGSCGVFMNLIFFLFTASHLLLLQRGPD